MKTHESIGTRTICQGLCDMNKPECSAHIYMEGTKTCFLKLRCAKQVDSYIMTWMGKMMPALPPPTSIECLHIIIGVHIPGAKLP